MFILTLTKSNEHSVGWAPGLSVAFGNHWTLPLAKGMTANELSSQNRVPYLEREHEHPFTAEASELNTTCQSGRVSYVVGMQKMYCAHSSPFDHTLPFNLLNHLIPCKSWKIVGLATHKFFPWEPILEKNQECRATDVRNGPKKINWERRTCS